MASPTLPGYITACLQLIKASPSGQPSKSPVSLVDTVAYSLSKILPLYPTTMRPFSAQITTALKAYVAPTSSDLLMIPESLRENARRVLVLLHYTAPKNGNSDEWIKGIRAAIKNSHDTADQIFRAVRESWESMTGYRGQAVSSDGEPSGGGDAADELPAWTGIEAGSERLIGLLDFLASHLKTTTKAPVNLPLGDLLDLTSRISLVTLPSSDDSVDLNPAIGRDEKAELWTVLPDIHTAALRLHLALITRLESNALPLSTDIIDQATRIFKSSHHLPTVRSPAYTLLASLLLLSGPSLPKLTVDTLLPLLHACCHDALPPQTTTTPSPAKPKDPSSSNADAFLTASPSTNPLPTATPAPHQSAAARLLPVLFSHLPQRQLTPDARALLDRTAVLAASKPALVASVLHPYKDARGRYYPSLLPFLVRQFPRDQEVEVLRTNLVRARGAAVYDASRTWGEDGGEGDVEMGDEEEVEVVEAVGEVKTATAVAAGWGDGGMDVDGEEKVVVERNAFFTTTTATSAVVEEKSAKLVVVPAVIAGDDGPLSPLKRKASQVDPGKPKRVDTGKAEKVVVVQQQNDDGEESDGDSDSDGGDSIQIDMTMEDDEEEDDE